VAAVVVDASAVVDYLLSGSPSACSVLADNDLYAPELLDAEVLSAISGLVRRRHVEQKRGRRAVLRLARATIERVPMSPLLLAAWELRHNLSPYDALYVALAQKLRCPLITVDRRLAVAPSVGVPVIVAG
jgi:predicted nucleic acid-binding protein